MRLDAHTNEIVAFLRKQGFTVHFPVDATVTDEEARVALKGRHTAVVYRDEFGSLQATVKTNLPPAPERLTYHDMLIVAIALEKREEAVRRLHEDVCGKPGFRQTAREYADELNNLGHVRRKVSALLRAERTRQYAAEAEEAAARG